MRILRVAAWTLFSLGCMLNALGVILYTWLGRQPDGLGLLPFALALAALLLLGSAVSLPTGILAALIFRPTSRLRMAILTLYLTACACLLVAFFVLAPAHSVAPANTPWIGSAARFQARTLGPGWHRGFFHQIRVAPPCYVLITFEPRSSEEQPLRLQHRIPITEVERLQVTTGPGTWMQEWVGPDLPAVPEGSWQEIDLAPLQPAEGACRFDEAPPRNPGGSP